MRIFISYASARLAEAEQVCTYLEENGMRCWIAPRDIPAGSNYGEEIIKGIEGCDGFVLLFDAAANASQHVLREVERAVSKKVPMVVYRLDETTPCKSMEYFLLANQWLDATGDKEQALRTLKAAFERYASEIGNEPDDGNESTEPVTEKAAGNENAEQTSGKAKPALKGYQMLLLAVAVVAVMLVLGMVQKSREAKESPLPTSSVSEDGGNTDVSDGEKTFLNVGDYVSFGSYMPGGKTAGDTEGAIEWQVVDCGEEGTLLVATKILAIRPFDCAESGTFNTDSTGATYDKNKKDSYTETQMREFRGSNMWEESDLRAWLNASGIVSYPGKVPQNGATDEWGNAYGAEAGFLTDFTKAEAALVTASEDGVFLLTKDEVERYAKNGALQPGTVPTEAAIAADESSWYLNYKDAGATDYIWATATAAEGSASELYYVDVALTGKGFQTMYAAASGFGIRPAIRIFTEEVSFVGDGSRQAPYRLAD